jgi:hypothetical protein
MLSTINESLTVLENDPAVKEKFSRKDRIKKL